MFISRRKHEKLLREAVHKAEEHVREEFYHREEHSHIIEELNRIRGKVAKLEKILDPTEGCSCGCNEKTVGHL